MVLSKSLDKEWLEPHSSGVLTTLCPKDTFDTPLPPPAAVGSGYAAADRGALRAPAARAGGRFIVSIDLSI